MLPIGVISDSFRLPHRDGIRLARELGADGIQIYAVVGAICPENLDLSARREFRHFVEGLGLQISALCGDLGGHGFERSSENSSKVERSKAIVDLAVDLGTDVVTTHIGVLPSEPTHPRYATMRESCAELGDYAASRGVTLAIETGPEPAAVLRAFLDDISSPGLGVNLDPANLAMVLNEDPVAAVHTLAPYIVHTHAKDGVNLQQCDPEAVYNAFAEGDFDEFVARTGELFRELPLGEGQVDWDRYLQALRDIGYSGYLTIEREVGDDPTTDIRNAITFLKSRQSKEN